LARVTMKSGLFSVYPTAHYQNGWENWVGQNGLQKRYPKIPRKYILFVYVN